MIAEEAFNGFDYARPQLHDEITKMLDTLSFDDLTTLEAVAVLQALRPAYERLREDPDPPTTRRPDLHIVRAG